MGKLSELVAQYYMEEKQIILETGPLWVKFGFVGALLGGLWIIAFIDGDHWSYSWKMLSILAFLGLPFALRAWDRYKIYEEMRHQRSIQIDMKLNALLGLISLQEDEN